MLYGTFMVTPGSMWLVALATDLLGRENVDPGSWTTPVWLENVRVEDARAFEELARELDPSITVSVIHYALKVSTSAHGQPCVEVTNAPPEVIKIIKAALSENMMRVKAYNLRSASGAFLQGEGTASGWILVEFWQPNYQPFIDYLNECLKELTHDG